MVLEYVTSNRTHREPTDERRVHAKKYLWDFELPKLCCICGNLREKLRFIRIFCVKEEIIEGI